MKGLEEVISKDSSSSKHLWFSKEPALRLITSTLRLGKSISHSVEILFYKGTWGLQKKGKRFNGGKQIIKRWREHFLIFLNLENLHKIPVPFIEKEHTIFTDIKYLFVLHVPPQQPGLPPTSTVRTNHRTVLFLSLAPLHPNLSIKMFWFLGASSEKPKNAGKVAQTAKLLHGVRSQNTGSFDRKQWLGRGSCPMGVFCGTCNVLFLDLGAGNMNIFSLWKFMSYTHRICVLFPIYTLYLYIYYICIHIYFITFYYRFS